LLVQLRPSLGHHRHRRTPGQQAAGQPAALTYLDLGIDAVALLAIQKRGQRTAAGLLLFHHQVCRHARDPEDPLLGIVLEQFQVKETTVGQTQSALRQRPPGQNTADVGLTAWTEVQFQSAGSQLQAGMDFESSRTVAGSLAAAAREEGGQGGGKADGSGIKDVDALEAAQQGDGSRSGRDNAVQGCRQNLCKAACGSGVQALVKRLRGDIDAEIRGEFGKRVKRCLGVVQPAEDQGLNESGAGEFANAADATGVASSLFGFGGQKGLQGSSQVHKITHLGLLRVDRGVVTAILELRSPCSCASLS
jgi:hypothetical protein